MFGCDQHNVIGVHVLLHLGAVRFVVCPPGGFHFAVSNTPNASLGFLCCARSVVRAITFSFCSSPAALISAPTSTNHRTLCVAWGVACFSLSGPSPFRVLFSGSPSPSPSTSFCPVIGSLLPANLCEPLRTFANLCEPLRTFARRHLYRFLLTKANATDL